MIRPTTEALDELKFQQLKSQLHQELIECLDLSVLAEMDQAQIEPEVRDAARRLCKQHLQRLTEPDQQRLLDGLIDEVFGMGPLEPLMRDTTITDIMVNGADEVYVERHGELERTDIVFADDAHVRRVVQRAVARVGRRIDEVTPMVDARLPDGSRLNAIMPPLCLKGTTLSIRRFGAERLTMRQLASQGALPMEVATFLEAAIEARMSVLISGGTGAGKTTLLGALAEYIPSGERLVTIEDSAELQLPHPHVIPLETRVENTEGTGDVTPRDLVRNSLRMRPDRIIIGEVRGAEALDMLQAMNSGHEGSLTTIHANDTRDALARLEMMVAMSGFDLPTPVIRQYIAAGVKLIVHVARLKGGERRLTRVSEIMRVEQGEFRVQDLFAFKQSGLDAKGKAEGSFFATGRRPLCLPRLEASGCEIPDGLFEKRWLSN